MGDGTEIGWTTASWNPFRGCSRTIADGAETSGCGDATGGGCYAERDGWRFAGPGLPYEGLVRMTPNGARWTGKVLLVDEHLLDPIRWQRPRKIFTTSVSDPFHERFTNEAIAIAYGVMAVTRRHSHQLLTKRVHRAREWYAWLAREAAAANGGRGISPAAFCFSLLQRYVNAKPDVFSEADRKLLSRANLVEAALAAPWPLPNLWLMASVEHQAAADDRVAALLAIPAAVHGLSLEPLLGPIDLTNVRVDLVGIDALRGLGPRHVTPRPRLAGRVRWCVIGAESGPRARPADDEWFKDLRDQCRAAGTAFFVKQLVVDGRLRKDIGEFPADLRIQEFPEVPGG